MTSDKPRTRWFRIHLSTAILIVLVCGGFILISMRPRLGYVFNNPMGAENACFINYGFPFNLYARAGIFFDKEKFKDFNPDEKARIYKQNSGVTYDVISLNDQGWVLSRHREFSLAPETRSVALGSLESYEGWNLIPFILNMAILTVALATIAFVCEWRIRRKQRKTFDNA
jgi:hypothetical protein